MKHTCTSYKHTHKHTYTCAHTYKHQHTLAGTHTQTHTHKHTLISTGGLVLLKYYPICRVNGVLIVYRLTLDAKTQKHMHTLGIGAHLNPTRLMTYLQMD